MKNKKRKKEAQRKRRRVLLAIIMILFVGIVLTTSTYAWFTANQTVTVNNINVNVSSADGIQISVDGIDWRALVTTTDITGASSTYATAVNQVPSTMVPVSTSKQTDSSTGFMTMYKGTISANAQGINRLASAQSLEDTNANTPEDFVVFDLFFKVNEDNKQVYLTNQSGVTTTDSPTKGIEYASRIAFVMEGNTPSSSTTSTIQGLHAASSVILWEPNNNAHTQAGINNASAVYLYDTAAGETPATGHHNVLTPSGTGAVVASYYGLADEFADAGLNDQTNGLFASVTPDIKTGTAGISSNPYQPVFVLNSGITKVRIYMWIEGQDVDCEDSASGSNLTYSLQFSILDRAP